MINYKEILQAAQAKGYVKHMAFGKSAWGENSLPSQEENEYCMLLEMTLIQKWLRDSFNIRIEVIGNDQNALCGVKVYYIGEIFTRPSIGTSPMFSDEEALLIGIEEALNLLPGQK